MCIRDRPQPGELQAGNPQAGEPQAEERQEDLAPDDSEPAALTRSTATATRIHIHPRPSTLPVSPQPPATADWAEEEEESFPSSEEERTPDGGIQEFVGHPYRSARMNNGEVVTSEMTPPPQTMVGGLSLIHI